MPKETTKDTKVTKQQTLLGFFGKPKIGSNVHSSSPSSSTVRTSSPASSVSRARPRAGLLPASSPLTVVASIDNVTIADEPDLAPMSSPSKGKGKDQIPLPMVANDDDDEFPISTTRRAKRRPVYVDSESDGDETAHASSSASKPTASRKKSKVIADDDDDDFVLKDEDEAKMAAEIEAAAAAFDAASPMELDSDLEQGFISDDSEPKAKAKKAKSKVKATPAARPAPKPLANGDGNSASASASGSNQFLTQAEIRKLDAKQEKKDSEDCFEFLKDIRDKDGNRKGDSNYDERTIFIPKKAWEKFTPFEHQFWEIKQDHYDTVLFFQKGKFYELYEDDAMIGHTEFDLKLTDRVKMKMVGVPEMSFEMWAGKFLAAGYKVGKVEQAETAIGMSMRQKDDKDKGKPPPGPKKGDIVRRELRNVFTNGTIVDGTFLTSDEANHCVAIKELTENPNLPSSFGICVLDASTGEFNMAAFEDDACRTRLETMFRQIRPKELVHAKGNLSVLTIRLLRNILPLSTIWSSLKPGSEFLEADAALEELERFFPSKEDIPAAITEMVDKPLALEALGGLMTYLKSLNLDKDLITQKNFNVYDPIRQGQSLVLDGQTLGHIEVLVNSEGGDEGTLLKMLQRCVTPFGKRLFRIWLTMPLRQVAAINDRLDAVEDLMNHPSFSGDFSRFAKGLPDLERLVSRIHAGSCKQKDFRNVLESFETIQKALTSLLKVAENFASSSVPGLLRSAPDLTKHLAHVKSMYKIENDTILPEPGADADCDDAVAAVEAVEVELEELLVGYKKQFKGKADYWHSAQGTKEVYHLQLAAGTSVPRDWVKVGSTKAFARYTTPETLPLIRKVQEVRETRTVAFRNFFRILMAEFDTDREIWLKAVRVFAELDCLLSLAKASNDLDEPRCRPEFVEADSAFVEFEDLRHPAMCVRSDFISNNVQLGGQAQRTVLLTGPNCAGKSTLMRMTAAGVILAQLGCFVPASRAKLSPIDKIQTRMGAYDNMFASASTFKVELDECSKILREAGPSSLVILDELGRGTSTFDGMAIASAVLHHLATHTLPLGFFATHYGSLTDDFTYHPNIRNMHMQTHVDDGKRDVTFLYKLIDGKAKSSYGTHVAYLAGFPTKIVERAEAVSHDFFEAFKQKQASRRRSDLPLVAQADFKWLMSQLAGTPREDIKDQMKMVRRSVPKYHEAC